MNVITFIMGIFTAILIGAQFYSYIPLPACWGIWGVVVIIGLFAMMIKNNPKKQNQEDEE